MSEKRYTVCKRCDGFGAIVTHDRGGSEPCPDCGHGDCAPGVVDAGVVWQSEVPTKGTWFAWHPTSPNYVHDDVVVTAYDVRCGGTWRPPSYFADGLWRFAPRTIADPPKE